MTRVDAGRQGELFQAAEALDIPGATYVPEFVSLDEERELIREIERGAWSHEFARRRQHYGIAYEKPDWTRPIPLPSWIETIAARIVNKGLFSRMPVQALVNEYEPGQGISAHKDYEPFDEVASLSLMSGCLMEFANVPRSDVKALWLEPRSLLVLTGEARHQWTHGIRPRLSDVVHGSKIMRTRRLSLTLRTILTEAQREP
jgi:alkylated DNA repair dioxygenase AlkB